MINVTETPKRHRAHESSERAFFIGLGDSQYFHILCTENTATLCDCSENKHATLSVSSKYLIYEMINDDIPWNNLE